MFTKRSKPGDDPRSDDPRIVNVSISNPELCGTDRKSSAGRHESLPADAHVARCACRAVSCIPGVAYAVRLGYRAGDQAGYAGFVIFHTALVCIMTAPWVKITVSRRLVGVSFIVVAIGASGAALRYEEIANYQYPVFILDAIGLAVLARWLYRVLRFDQPGDESG